MSIKFKVAPRISLNISPESRFAFEFFAFRDVEMVDEMAAFLKFSKNKLRLLDIGALFGIFSLAFCAQNQGRKALAVEPSFIPFETLETNISLNPKLDIKPHLLALGSRNGKLKMHYDWMHLIALPKKKNKKTPIKKDLTEVDVAKLDDLMKSEKFAPDIIKLDAEGYELEILKGGKNYISKNKPLIFLETHSKLYKEQGVSVSKLIEQIRNFGYTICDLDGMEIDNPKEVVGSIPNYHVILTRSPLI